jgi:histone acetyltransferase (RNA polymerase elongator complex component)
MSTLCLGMGVTRIELGVQNPSDGSLSACVVEPILFQM